MNAAALGPDASASRAARRPEERIAGGPLGGKSEPPADPHARPQERTGTGASMAPRCCWAMKSHAR
jgi:hypothetical protein